MFLIHFNASARLVIEGVVVAQGKVHKTERIAGLLRG
jgi:hypothetical protein